MQHALRIERHMRQKPTSGPWAEYEHTGTATVTCSCGLDTGTVPADDALSVYRQHETELKTPRAATP